MSKTIGYQYTMVTIKKMQKKVMLIRDRPTRIKWGTCIFLIALRFYCSFPYIQYTYVYVWKKIGESGEIGIIEID